MTDSTADGFDSAAPVPRTAGGLLRAARQAQGLHIAALAASIKVVPRKLEWLEADQFDQLPDATFTRALAQTVCRTLKIDPAPVLALLPPLLGNRLHQVANGLNTPFHERPGRLVTQQWSGVASPALWIALALVVAAAAVYLVPAQWFAGLKPAAVRAPAAASGAASSTTSSVEESGMAVSAGTSSAQGAAEATSSSVSSTAAVPAASSAARPTAMNNALNAIRAIGNGSGTPAPAPRAGSLPEPEVATPPPPGILQLHAKAASWVDVTDARGQTLLARLMQPNESVALDGVMPFKLKVGNAGAVTVVFRGEPVVLEPSTRDNVARLVLK